MKWLSKRVPGLRKGFAVFWTLEFVAPAVFAAAVFGGCGPFAPIPGGERSGPVGAVEVDDR
ncbi:MAG: hypothetical protein GY910_26810 [bacterium]|nr:hypothetical protein [bacterium]